MEMFVNQKKKKKKNKKQFGSLKSIIYYKWEREKMEWNERELNSLIAIGSNQIRNRQNSKSKASSKSIADKRFSVFSISIFLLFPRLTYHDH